MSAKARKVVKAAKSSPTVKKKAVKKKAVVSSSEKTTVTIKKEKPEAKSMSTVAVDKQETPTSTEASTGKKTVPEVEVKADEAETTSSSTEKLDQPQLNEEVKNVKPKKNKKPFAFNRVFVLVFHALLCLVLSLDIVSLFIPLAGETFNSKGLLLALLTTGWNFAVFLSVATIGVSIVFSVISLIRMLRYHEIRPASSFINIFTALVVILFNVGNNFLSIGLLVTIILSMAASAGIIGALLYTRINSNHSTDTKAKMFLFTSFGSLVIALSIFFIPLNIKNESIYGNDNYLLGILLDSSSATSAMPFVALFFGGIFIGALTLADKVLESYFNDNDSFKDKSKVSGFYNLFVTTVFLIFSVIMQIVKNYTASGSPYVTIAYIPFVANTFIVMFQSYLIGKKTREIKIKQLVEKTGNEKSPEVIAVNSILKHQITMMVLQTLMAGVMITTLFLKFLIVKTDDGVIDASYKTIDIIVNAKNANSFAIIGYVFFVIGLTDALLFITSTCAVLVNSKSSSILAKVSIVTIFCSVLLVGISSTYFLASIRSSPAILASYFPDVPSIIEYIDDTLSRIKISDQMLGPTVAAVAILLLTIILKPLTKIENELAKLGVTTGTADLKINSDELLGNGKGAEEKEEEKDKTDKVALVEDTSIDFDSCPSFTELDNHKPTYESDYANRAKRPFEDMTLEKLVNFVVEYARNSRLHLFYSREDIATFVAGLNSTKLSILQGMSGTGKTSLPKIFLEAINGNCEIVEVESSWRDKNELIGYYNDFSKSFAPKKFTRALYKASLNPDIVTFIVLDEMNLSRIEYYFSDFLSLMENEEGKREIRLTNNPLFNTYENARHPYLNLKDNHTIVIPSNIWFIGTANRDESTFEISDKVYDRAYTMNFDHRAQPSGAIKKPLQPLFVSYKNLKKLFTNVPSVGFSIEKSEVIGEIEKLLSPYNISFGNRIARQIEVFVDTYCACFPKPESVIDEALETILLSKVVHKLEYKNVTNKEELVHTFKRLKLNRCAEFVSRLIEEF